MPAWALTQTEITTYQGADRQRVLEDGARKEGKVILYSPLGPAALHTLTEAFEKKYPFIDMQTWTAPSNQVLGKVLAEQRADAEVADVMDLATSATSAAMQAKATVPFYAASLKDYPKEFYDPAHLWAASRVAYFGIGYNTKLVPAAQAPKTFEDLLDPRWKGRMAWPAPTPTGAALFITNARMTMGEEKAAQYLQKLSAQKIVNYSMGSAVALVGRIAQGEYQIGIQVFANNPIQAASKGASVDIQMLDPVVTSLDTTQIVAGAPHPYAAALLIEYYLSAEGQSVMSGAGYFSPDPLIDPAANFRRIVPRLIKMNQNVITPEISDTWLESSQALWEKYFR